MSTTTHQLISAATFRSMVKRGARSSDLDHVQIFKSGTILAPPGEPESRDVPLILSNSKRDREGDTINVDGWDLTNYRRSPVVLWAHQHDELPVARAANVRIEGGNLKAVDHFAPAAMYPFADSVLKLIRGGFINACSVGFKPGDFDPSDTGLDFKSGHELLEHSICPVPAHPDALVEAKSLGINTAPLREWIEHILDVERSGARSDATVRKQLERLRVQADPRGRSALVALSHLRMPTTPITAPTTPDPDEAARQARFEEMRQNLAHAGTRLSLASAHATALTSPTSPAHDEDPDPDDADPPSETDRLDAIVEHTTAAATAAAAVASMATQLGGAPADAPSEPVPSKALTKAARERAMLQLLAAATVLRERVKVGARHNAVDRQLIQAVHDHALALGAACAPEAPKQYRRGEVLLDGKPLLDDDDVDLSGITEADVAAVVGRVIAENLMRVSGKLPW